ncbi:MAG: tetratricopeptide repeat protein [Anaerolineales bacterium]|nr:tetratricopeptide repeat protein [Anaerolineales bacterium]
MNTAELNQLLQQAEQAQSRQAYQEALADYRRILAETSADVATAAEQPARLRALRQQGLVLHILGRQDAAMSSFQQYYLEAGSSQRAVDALVLIGRQHVQMGQPLKGLAAHNEALQLAEALNDTAGRATALSGIGGAFVVLGRLEEALTNLERSLALFSQLGNEMEQARVGNQLGITYARLGMLDKAVSTFRRSLALARRTGPRETAIILGNLGQSYQELYDMEQALQCHQEGLALAERVGLRSGIPDLCRNLGVDLMYLGRLPEGLGYLHRALEMSETVGQQDERLQTLYSLALAERQSGELAHAEARAQQLIALAETNKMRGYLADGLHALGLCKQARGDASAAEQLWQRAIFIAHETARRFLLWQLHAAMAEIAGNPDLTRVHYRIAAEVIEQIAYPLEDKELRQTFLNAAPIRAILQAARG